MTTPSKADVRIALAFCGIVGLYDVLCVASAIVDSPILGYRLDVLFSDFLVFHAAARAFVEGQLAAIYDSVALTHLQNAFYAGRLPGELSFRPFLYPPLWLLDVLPFAFLPVSWAIATFLALTAAACATALRLIGLGWIAILAILSAPASVWVVLAGQNTFLSVALFYGGLALLERRPLAAGVLLGLLAYKPQIWILLPVALVSGRYWRALISLSGTAAILSLATLVAFGVDLWRQFFAAAQLAGTGSAAADMFFHVHTHMTTLFAAAKILGVGNGVATALQLVGSAPAIVAAIWAFARRGASAERTALLAAATSLISPYALNYDLLLLAPAVALLFLDRPATGTPPAERVVFLAAWLIPSISITLNHAGLPVTPLVVLSLAAVSWMRLRATPKVELPGAAPAR